MDILKRLKLSGTVVIINYSYSASVGFLSNLDSMKYINVNHNQPCTAKLNI